jgi:hypothetical protein
VICFFCHRRITGAEVAHRVEWRRIRATDWDESIIAVFGEDAPDGTLREARGQLLKVSHHKCYHAGKKRQELLAARAADPEAQPARETDWRHQEVIGVEDLGSEGH